MTTTTTGSLSFFLFFSSIFAEVVGVANLYVQEDLAKFWLHGTEEIRKNKLGFLVRMMA
jgi:hypothetical protein